jgi:hypothetical protein
MHCVGAGEYPSQVVCSMTVVIQQQMLVALRFSRAGSLLQWVGFQLGFLWWLGWRHREQARSHRGFCVFSGIGDWPLGFGAFDCSDLK